MSRNSSVRSSSHLGQKATISHSSRSSHSKFSSPRGQCVQPRARGARHDSNGSIIHAPSRTWVLAPLYTLSSTLYDYHMLPWASSTLLLQFGVHRVVSYIQTPRSKLRCPPLLAPYWPPFLARFNKCLFFLIIFLFYLEYFQMVISRPKMTLLGQFAPPRASTRRGLSDGVGKKICPQHSLFLKYGVPPFLP